MNARRTVAVAAALALVPALASCGFNQQTDQVYQAAVGTDNRDSSVDVLNVVVVSGEDGSGTVVATLVNNDDVEDDALLAVEDADTTLEIELSGDNEIPAGGLLNLAEEGGITATGDAIVPGDLVTLTWTFQRADPVTFNAPVVSAENPDYADVPLPGDAGTDEPTDDTTGR